MKRKNAKVVIKPRAGGPRTLFTFTAQTGFSYDLAVDAKLLAEHLEKKKYYSRTPFLPLIPEVLRHPEEVWATYERSERTGKVVLRMRMLKVIKTGEKEKGLVMVFQTKNGILESWTLFPVGRLEQVENYRRGKLLYKKGRT